ncbi:unnamed protein product [Boreogadus saida]
MMKKKAGDEGEEERKREEGEGLSLCFLKEEILLEIGHFCGLQAGFGAPATAVCFGVHRTFSVLNVDSCLLSEAPRESSFFSSRSCLWQKKKKKRSP